MTNTISSPFDLPANSNPFTTLFRFIATDDNTPYHVFPNAASFRQDVCGGEEQIFTYLKTLARKGGDIVASSLGTEVMEHHGPEPDRLRDCAFANIKLPFSLLSPSSQTTTSTTSQTPPFPLPTSKATFLSRKIEKLLLTDHKTFLPVYEYKGNLWTRISAQIYLDEEDFVWAAKVLKETCELAWKETCLDAVGDLSIS